MNIASPPVLPQLLARSLLGLITLSLISSNFFLIKAVLQFETVFTQVTWLVPSISPLIEYPSLLDWRPGWTLFQFQLWRIILSNPLKIIGLGNIYLYQKLILQKLT
jgi:hypothetical protein